MYKVFLDFYVSKYGEEQGCTGYPAGRMSDLIIQPEFFLCHCINPLNWLNYQHYCSCRHNITEVDCVVDPDPSWIHAGKNRIN